MKIKQNSEILDDDFEILSESDSEDWEFLTIESEKKETEKPKEEKKSKETEILRQTNEEKQESPQPQNVTEVIQAYDQEEIFLVPKKYLPKKPRMKEYSKPQKNKEPYSVSQSATNYVQTKEGPEYIQPLQTNSPPMFSTKETKMYSKAEQSPILYTKTVSSSHSPFLSSTGSDYTSPQKSDKPFCFAVS